MLFEAIWGAACLLQALTITDVLFQGVGDT
jgi:hypothetical protein